MPRAANWPMPTLPSRFRSASPDRSTGASAGALPGGAPPPAGRTARRGRLGGEVAIDVELVGGDVEADLRLPEAVHVEPCSQRSVLRLRIEVGLEDLFLHVGRGSALEVDGGGLAGNSRVLDDHRSRETWELVGAAGQVRPDRRCKLCLHDALALARRGVEREAGHRQGLGGAADPVGLDARIDRLAAGQLHGGAKRLAGSRRLGEGEPGRRQPGLEGAGFELAVGVDFQAAQVDGHLAGIHAHARKLQLCSVENGLARDDLDRGREILGAEQVAVEIELRVALEAQFAFRFRIGACKGELQVDRRLALVGDPAGLQFQAADGGGVLRLKVAEHDLRVGQLDAANVELRQSAGRIRRGGGRRRGLGLSLPDQVIDAQAAVCPPLDRRLQAVHRHLVGNQLTTQQRHHRHADLGALDTGRLAGPAGLRQAGRRQAQRETRKQRQAQVAADAQGALVAILHELLDLGLEAVDVDEGDDRDRCDDQHGQHDADADQQFP